MILKELRLTKKLSQQILALKSGYSQPTISNIERGFAVPNRDQKRRIAKALGERASTIDWPDCNREIRDRQ